MMSCRLQTCRLLMSGLPQLRVQPYGTSGGGGGLSCLTHDSKMLSTLVLSAARSVSVPHGRHARDAAVTGGGKRSTAVMGGFDRAGGVQRDSSRALAFSIIGSGWATRINARAAADVQWMRNASGLPISHGRHRGGGVGRAVSGPEACLAATVLQKRFDGGTPYALAFCQRSSSTFARNPLVLTAVCNR
jgi:hypothetical protein